MTLFTFLGWLTGGVFALSILNTLTQRAADYRTRTETENLGPAPEEEQPVQPQAEPVTPTHRAAWWWRQVLTVEGMLGLLFVLLECAILLINSYIIAISFEVLFLDPGPPLFTLTVYTWERPVTFFDLYGVLISLGQMIASSICYRRFNGGPWLATVSFPLALICLIAFEVTLAYLRGFKVDGQANAILSALLALGTASLEAGIGIFVIDHLLAPLFLAFFWTASAPLWALLSRWERRPPPRPRRRGLIRRRGNMFLRALAWPFTVLDHAVMAPLRGAADFTQQMFTHLTTSLFRKGGRHYDIPQNKKDTSNGAAHSADDSARL